jgi:SNF2 family DNA or RNA helicase
VLATKPNIRIRLALTGTPITNGLQDAWSIYRFVRPEVFERWQDFQNHYLIMGGYKATQITGYRNEDEARRLIASTSFQWEGDLPSPPDVPIRVRLTKKNQAVYETLRKKAIAEIQSLDGTSHMVVAQIVLTLVLRLQQITSGFTRDVGEEEIEVGTEKARATIDLIEDAIANGNRVVVFCRFLHDIALLAREMPSDWKVGVIDGSRSSQNRKDTVAAFDAGKYNVLLAQIKAGGLGIDLASAQVAIFYSIGFSLDEFLQAKGRLSGALRQRHPVTFYHMICADTVDEKVYAALSSKATIARNVTDLSYALDLVGGTTVDVTPELAAMGIR